MTSTAVVQRNGRVATAEDLAPLAFAGYAHFTAMQVRGGQVRGLDLHLERLRTASMELFGQALPDERVRAHLRAAIEAGPADLSLTATVYSPAGEFTVAGAEVEPEVLIRTGPAASGPEGPLTLTTVEHERALPAVKHVGEVAKTYFLRQAVAQGFDDAAFVDRQGRLSEATIWNLAFWDGAAVVWPEAEMLAGTTMGIVRRQLDRLGVPQRVQEVTPADLPALAGGVVMNSWTPGVAVRRIGSAPLPEAPSFLELLHRAYQAEPLTSP
ncbi:aminotransferase class IV family protein [Nonomuraea dietziae]|uniref:aminotransferase class IV family protein n=1 Tax=Nonomuraea dietziae TaxID=65515 RepID=UPI0033C92C95